MSQTTSQEFEYHKFHFNLSPEGMKLAEEVGCNPARGFTQMTIRFDASWSGLLMIELEQVTDAVAEQYGI